MNKINKLKEAINNLTDLYEFGRLQADTAPAEFLEQVTNELKQLRAEKERLLKALKEIRDNQGKVCKEYEICKHESCRSSYTSWAIASKALEGE